MTWIVQLVRRLILNGGAFLLFFSVGSVLSHAVLPAIRLFSADCEVGARRCRGIVARTWVAFHAYMRVCGLIHYDPRKSALTPPVGGALFVANHPTLVDVTALVSACPDLIFVVKRPMYRNPLVGPLLRACDQIEVGEGPFAGVAVMDEVLERVRRGQRVLIFPEGTRSPKGGLGPFFSGAFEVAARAHVPVVPVLVRCDPPALMRGQPWHDIPERLIRLSVTQLPAVNVHGDATAARDAVRAQFVQMLQTPAAHPAEATDPAARRWSRRERGSVGT